MKIKTLLVLFSLLIILSPSDKKLNYVLGILKKFNINKKKCTYLKIDKNFSLNPSNNRDLYFKYPAMVNIENENIFILDNSLHRLVVSNKKGKLIHIVGKYGRGPGDLISPQSFYIDQNEIYIKNQNGIDVFSKDYKFLRRIKTFVSFMRFIVLNQNIYCRPYIRAQNVRPLFMKIDLKGKIIDEYYVKEFEDKLYANLDNGFILNLNDRLIYFSRVWNEIYIFDYKCNLLKKSSIQYDLINEILKWNTKDKVTQGGNVISFIPYNSSIKIFKGGIYVLLNLPRLEILKVDLEGKVLKHYYNDDFNYMRWRDFAIQNENGKLVFYVLGYERWDDKGKIKSQDFNLFRLYINDN